MTIHEKYNLKTDVPSIKERMEGRKHSEIARAYIIERDGHPLDETDEALHEAYITMATVELRAADLELICSLAEKGERYEKAVKAHRAELEPHRHIDVCAPYAIKELEDIITESEGEPR